MPNKSFNSTSIRNLAEKIKNNTAEIDSEIKKLESVCSNIQTSWKDKGSNIYVDKVNQKRSQLLQVNNDFKNLAALLEKYATSMDQKQQSIVEEGSAL